MKGSASVSARVGVYVQVCVKARDRVCVLEREAECVNTDTPEESDCSEKMQKNKR